MSHRERETPKHDDNDKLKNTNKQESPHDNNQEYDQEYNYKTIQDLSAADLRSLASMLDVPARRKLTSAEKLAGGIVQSLRETRTLSRRIDDLPDAVQFSDTETFYRLENALGSYNCHHGQRKLFFTMLEFLTLCTGCVNLATAVVVYVGAAPGYNMRMISELFPCTMYLLIDPAPFDIKETQNLRIWRRLFTDESVEDVKAFARLHGRTHILFVSDIRMSPKEEDIGRDMASQQRWGVKLRAAAMMFKFRLPYFGTSVSDELIREAEQLDAIRHLLDLPPAKSKTPHSYLYLDGTILLQLYAPLRSAETRLVVFHPALKCKLKQRASGRALCPSSTRPCRTALCAEPPRMHAHGRAHTAATLWHYRTNAMTMGYHENDHSGGSTATQHKYPMRYWDFKKYEAKMNAFNIVNRSLLTYHSPCDPDGSTKLGLHLLGYGSDYESVAEYQLAYEYLEWRQRCVHEGSDRRTLRRATSLVPAMAPPDEGPDDSNNNNISLQQVVHFLHRLNMRLVHHYTSKVSLVLCAIKTMAAHTRKYNELDENARTRQLRLVSHTALSRFETQMTVVRNGGILSDRDKQEMIDAIASEVKILSREYASEQRAKAQ